MGRSVYVLTDLDGGESYTIDSKDSAFGFWDNYVSSDRFANVSFIRVDLGRKPKIWAMGLKVDGYLRSSGGLATKKVPGGACQFPRQLP